MNELPVFDAYSKPDRISVLYSIVVFILGFMIIMNIGDRGAIIEYIVFLCVLIIALMVMVMHSRQTKRPVIRIYEDRIERRFLWQKEYKQFYFSGLSKVSIKYEFPSYDVLKLEFKDGRKPVLMQLTNLSVAVEDMYKYILEHVNQGI